MRERQREGGTGRESMRVCSVINHTRIVSFFSNFRLPDNSHHEHIVSSHFFFPMTGDRQTMHVKRTVWRQGHEAAPVSATEIFLLK